MAICRVYERPDGSLLVVHPDPRGRRPGEAEAAWLARTWARLSETSPAWFALPHHDMDEAALPPRDAPCADGCGETHPVRDQWRLQGVGEQRAPAVDPTARNLHAELHHLVQAEDDEVAKAAPDAARLAALRRAQERIRGQFRGDGGAVPPREHVALLTEATLRARRGAGGRP